MTHHNPDLDSTSDWLNQISYAARPIRNTTQIWSYFWLVKSNFLCGTTNQKHYPDLGTDASSVWNFCTCFSDVTWRGTSDSIAKCWLFSQAKHFPDIRKKNPSWWVREEKLKDSSTGQLLTTLKSTMPGFYLGFIVWGRSTKWPKATNFLAGSGGMPSGKFFKWICPVMQSSAFWDTILRNVTVVFYFLFLVPCHIVSLDREYLLHVHWPRHIWMIFLI